MNLSIGILTHFAPATLDHTLSTYKTSGLMDLTDDMFVVIQKSERQEEEEEVCRKYGLRYVSLPDNGRMATGFKAIYDNARHEYILFLENDFCTYVSNKEVIYYITNAINFLQNGITLVRGRSRKNCGSPNYAYDWYKDCAASQFEDSHSQYLSESMYWLEHPDVVYPTKIKKVDSIIPAQSNEESWYQTNSRYCVFTNNPYMCSKTTFKNCVIPYVIPGNSLEREVDIHWQNMNKDCIFGFGIFTHDRKYDGHN